jgi:hypothetical protein
MSTHAPARSNRTHARLLATFAACGLCAFGAATLASRSDGRPAVRTLTFILTEDRSESYVIDNPPKGASGGDLFTYSLTARRHGRVVGRMEGMGTANDVKYRGNVKVQYLVLRDGTIAIVGGGQDGAPGVGRPDSRIWDAIVGGSGAYAGARGWVSGHDLADGSLSLTMHLIK